MMAEQPAGCEQDLFSGDELFQFNEASTGQRFLNYLIDVIFMQYGLALLTGYILVKILMAIAPDFAYSVFAESEGFDFFFSTWMIGIFTYLIYYTFCEKVFKGYTLGKLITGTRAIRTDGQELSFRDAILRSLSRLVPFEAFSGFGGEPWHDTWTNTMVIKTR
jgi:uncharacterized RDD family membrane protein YckC